MINRQLRTGLALVEMVIVIMTLGILAVVAAPRLLDPQHRAQQETTRHQLAVLRKAIELYEARTGTYPAVDQLPAAMTTMLNGPFPAPLIGSVQGDGGVFYDRDPNVEIPVVTGEAVDLGRDAEVLADGDDVGPLVVAREEARRAE